MTGPPPNWKNVGDAVQARMKDLRLRQADLVRLTGLSDPTVRGIMNGAPRGTPRDPAPALVCDALGWTPDSIDRLLAGRKPVLVATGSPLNGEVLEFRDRTVDELQRLADEVLKLRAEVDELMRRTPGRESV